MQWNIFSLLKRHSTYDWRYKYSFLTHFGTKRPVALSRSLNLVRQRCGLRRLCLHPIRLSSIWARRLIYTINTKYSSKCQKFTNTNQPLTAYNSVNVYAITCYVIATAVVESDWTLTTNNRFQHRPLPPIGAIGPAPSTRTICTKKWWGNLIRLHLDTLTA